MRVGGVIVKSAPCFYVWRENRVEYMRMLLNMWIILRFNFEENIVFIL